MCLPNDLPAGTIAVRIGAMTMGKKMDMDWWDTVAAQVKAATRLRAGARVENFRPEEVRQAVVHGREDITMAVVQLSAVNQQLAGIKSYLCLILAVLVFIAATAAPTRQIFREVSSAVASNEWLRNGAQAQRDGLNTNVVQGHKLKFAQLVYTRQQILQLSRACTSGTNCG